MVYMFTILYVCIYLYIYIYIFIYLIYMERLCVFALQSRLNDKSQECHFWHVYSYDARIVYRLCDFDLALQF